MLLHTEKLCSIPIRIAGAATIRLFFAPPSSGSFPWKRPDDPSQGGTLRTRALDEIKKVKWDPAWGEERISNMIATRPDWCISRQRIWGVPIAVFSVRGLRKPLNDPAMNRKVIELFAKSGADAWYTPEADALLAPAHSVPALRWNHVQKRN